MADTCCSMWMAVAVEDLEASQAGIGEYWRFVVVDWGYMLGIEVVHSHLAVVFFAAVEAANGASAVL